MEDPDEAEDEPWDAKPIYKNMKGQATPVEFFMIGALAKALHRTTHAIHKWEQSGFLPKAKYGKKVDGALGGSSRRMYTRAQVEGLVRIAREEGLLGPRKEWQALKNTNFAKRAHALFKGDPAA